MSIPSDRCTITRADSSVQKGLYSTILAIMFLFYCHEEISAWEFK